MISMFERRMRRSIPDWLQDPETISTPQVIGYLLDTLQILDDIRKKFERQRLIAKNLRAKLKGSERTDHE